MPVQEGVTAWLLAVSQHKAKAMKLSVRTRGRVCDGRRHTACIGRRGLSHRSCKQQRDGSHLRDENARHCDGDDDECESVEEGLKDVESRWKGSVMSERVVERVCVGGLGVLKESRETAA